MAWFLTEKLSLHFRIRPPVDAHWFASKLVSCFLSILLTRKSSWQDEIIDVQEIIPGWKCKFEYDTFFELKFL